MILVDIIKFYIVKFLVRISNILKNKMISRKKYIFIVLKSNPKLVFVNVIVIHECLRFGVVNYYERRTSKERVL